MTEESPDQRNLDDEVGNQQPPLRIEYNAVLEYDTEEEAPADPARTIRRLVQEEAGFGDVTVERRGE